MRRCIEAALHREAGMEVQARRGRLRSRQAEALGVDIFPVSPPSACDMTSVHELAVRG